MSDENDHHNTDAANELPENVGDFTLPVVTNQPGPRTTTLRGVLDRLAHDQHHRIPPVCWPLGVEPSWGNFHFRPHSIITLGGPTNVGKTSFALNAVCKAMITTPTLRVLIAHNESQSQDLVKRLLAMVSGVNLQHVRALDPTHFTDADMHTAMTALDDLADRLAILEMPFTLEDVVVRAEDFRADIVVIDVLQKLRLGDYDGDSGDIVGRIMPRLRDLANSGRCVFTVASISREGVRHLQKRVGRMDHDELDACVFLHNSEIESSTDDAYVLVAEPGAASAMGPGSEYVPVRMWLQHLKGRDELRIHVPLAFDGRYQRFAVRPTGPDGRPTQPRSVRPGTGVAGMRAGGAPTANTRKKSGRTASTGRDDENWVS